MARPSIPNLSGIMAGLAYGRLTMAEVAAGLGVSRSTILRRCKAMAIDPQAARARYVRAFILRSQGTGWRPPTKSDLRAKADRAVSTFVSDR